MMINKNCPDFLSKKKGNHSGLVVKCELHLPTKAVGFHASPFTLR